MLAFRAVRMRLLRGQPGAGPAGLCPRLPRRGDDKDSLPIGVLVSRVDGEPRWCDVEPSPRGNHAHGSRNTARCPADRPDRCTCSGGCGSPAGTEAGSARGSATRTFPTDGNGGYDVAHYDLDSRYFPDTDQAARSGHHLRRAPPRRCRRSTSTSTAWRSTASGSTAGSATWRHVGDELTITPERAIAQGILVPAVIVATAGYRRCWTSRPSVRRACSPPTTAR